MKYLGLVTWGLVLGQSIFAGWGALSGAKDIEDISRGTLIRKPKFSEAIRFPALVMKSLSANQVSLQMDGASQVVTGGMPTLPVIIRKYALPQKGSFRIRLENLKLQESDQKINVRKSPPDRFWGKNPDGKIPLDSSKDYFPGKFIEVRETRDGVWVKLFPVQYDTRTGKVVKVINADLMFEEVPPPREVGAPPMGKSSIILTTEALVPLAKILQDFHLLEFKVESEIATVESIAKSEEPVSEVEMPDGLKNDTAKDMGLKAGYPYLTARKIKSYLEKRFGRLHSVTILGTAEDVPPSYYFWVPTADGHKYGVTDQCYSSSHECLTPEIAVGRLPFRTQDELTGFLGKTKHWLANASAAPKELTLFGGKPFPMDIYVGEVGTMRTVSGKNANWKGLTKSFRTMNTYSRSKVWDFVRGNDRSAFGYQLDHGGGNVLYIEDEEISVKQLEENQKRATGLEPFYVSIACTNGAFDESLLSEPLYDTDEGKSSVGVALVKSAGGPIAYLGSSRPAMGMPVYEIDKKGNLMVTGATYGIRIMDGFYEAYVAEKGGLVADLLLKSYQRYLNEWGADSPKTRWSYWNMVLLGDPALRLPKRASKEEVYSVANSTTAFQPSESSLPFWKITPEGILNLAYQTESKLQAALYRLEESGEVKVDEKDLGTDGIWKVKLPKTPSTFFVRMENAEGVPADRLIYFETTK